MKIDRPLAVLDVAQEAADTRGRAIIDLALDRDPAIAARTARIGRAFGIVDNQPGAQIRPFRPTFRHAPRREPAAGLREGEGEIS